jgi:D-alanyl-D-alanine carboxypeptidase
MNRRALNKRVAAALHELGAAGDLIGQRGLPLYDDARRLTPVGLGTDGRDKFLTPAAAAAWLAMREAARRDGIDLLLISSFRSFEFQLALIRGKLAKGRSIEEILTVNAPPGCSEHHTGRAIDLGIAGLPPLEEDFERTAAFGWLTQQAQRYGYRMSYPRNNPQGYLYEPWHWCHHQD